MNQLILKNDGAGPRHYLDGRPVHCSDVLEILLGPPNGVRVWLPVRFEASLGDFSVCLYASHVQIYPDLAATFRWPKGMALVIGSGA